MTVAPGSPECSRAKYANATFGMQQINSRVVVVEVGGEIDLFSAPEFGAWVRRSGMSASRMIIDMTGVEFFGSAGLPILQAVDSEKIAAGESWAMICGRPVLRLLRAAGLDTVFPCYPSVQGALGSWKIRTA